MNTDERYLARILFKLRALKSSGQAYESLFTEVMTYSNPRFRQIKPQGKFGDRKNDGYDPDMGYYYQVFAPEDPGQSVASACKKAKEDFAGLLKHWGGIGKGVCGYFFAFNDKYSGSNPTLEAVMQAISNNGGPAVCEVFLVSNLEDKLMALDDDQIKAIVGHIPNPRSISSINYGPLKDVLEAVLACDSRMCHQQAMNAPDLADKIAFNGLTKSVAPLLSVGSFQAGRIDGYFSRNSSGTKQQVRDALNGIYQSVKSSGLSGDYAFFAILDMIVPRAGLAVQDAAIVLMAYFFESCDIFEDPCGQTMVKL